MSKKKKVESSAQSISSNLPLALLKIKKVGEVADVVAINSKETSVDEQTLSRILKKTPVVQADEAATVREVEGATGQSTIVRFQFLKYYLYLLHKLKKFMQNKLLKLWKKLLKCFLHQGPTLHLLDSRQILMKNVILLLDLKKEV